MREISDRYPTQHSAQRIASLSTPKRIGGYLVEAGLLTHDQINVALTDQQATGMRFGEIIVARGWLKEQTVEWIVTKVIEPERQSGSPLAHLMQAAEVAPVCSQSPEKPTKQPANSNQPAVLRQAVANQGQAKQSTHSTAHFAESVTVPSESERAAQKTFVRREVPIAKPLPSVGSPDGDVNWVG
jgi:hypothetical protein